MAASLFRLITGNLGETIRFQYRPRGLVNKQGDHGETTITPENNRFDEENRKQIKLNKVLGHLNFGTFLSRPSVKQQWEMNKFNVLREHTTVKFSPFFLVNATPANLVPGWFAAFVQIERVEIITK